jgi:transcriptional regulator with XRE-family HTH domain
MKSDYDKKLATEIWRRVRECMDRENMNFSQLARRLGVARQTMSSWRKRGIPTSYIPLIGRIFTVSTEWLTHGLEVDKFHHKLSLDERLLLEALRVLDDVDRDRLITPILEEAARIARYLNKK